MISVTILTKNSAKSLKATLESVKRFDEVLLYDTGSVDETLAIGTTFPNVRVIEGPFLGFGKTHNRASSLAKHEWILSLDSDEVLSPELEREILSLSLDQSSVYSFRRKNFYRGKWVKSGGWWPDSVVRLYARSSTHFSDAAVHERVLTEGLQLVELKGLCLHAPYETVSDFLRKMQYYGDLFAEQNAGKKSATLWTALYHGAFAFFKAYVLQRGFLEGGTGIEIALYQANSSFYKYLKLRERTRRCPEEKGSVRSSSLETKR